MVKVCFLFGLKEVVGENEIQIAYCGRLSDLLEALCNRYGQRLRKLLFHEKDPTQRSIFVKILINGEDIKGMDPRLKGDEAILLFLPIAGG